MARERTQVGANTTDVGLWVIQVTLGAYMVYSGFSLFDAGMVPKFEEIGLGQWLRYVTGVLEIAGGLGLLVPVLCGLAALGLSLVLAGATLTELFLVAKGGPVLPLVLFGIAVGLFLCRRDTVLALVAKIRS
jgi:putative oxidoreductase